MDIRQLEYFREVAVHLSFTKAAAKLHVSQPSLSKSIKNLESELGVPLFYRSSKTLDLTDAGKAVLAHAKHVLGAFENMASELSDITEYKKGEMKIGIPPIVGAAFFSKLISSFKEAFPQVDITLTEVGSKAIKEGIQAGDLDVGLVCNIPLENDSFEAIELTKEPLLLVVHEEHHLVGKNKVVLNDLKEESFILYRKDFTLHDRMMEQFVKRDFQPNVVCESSQRDFMLEMVGAKLGVALLPKTIAENPGELPLKAIPISDIEINLELGVIWKKNKYLSYVVRQFIEMTRELDSDEKQGT
ncbi:MULTISPECIES: LysR family transcriptional regulator [Bacillaceae]|uniref:LysR family transcriptional regulator n=1 Tax=Evansella alkalicola TaxID=745819 RepID=A0ABS6JVH8_9BACI|nr:MULTISPECIES: LysR family transcriptional regulator [Bacillaceae]MBU9722582.1 LysR family transcriptional regulator [Bacillus alkalicola]